MAEKISGVIRKWTAVLGASATRPGNAVQALIDGTETFAAIYQALITARAKGHYIYFLGWHMDDSLSLVEGSPKSSLFEVFRAASPKVQIRVMLWNNPFSYRINSRTVKHVNERASGAAILDAHTPLRRSSHHQKVLIVKGALGLIGFCGGVDVNKDRLETTDAVRHRSSGPDDGWQHDVHCRVMGPAAHDLLKVFVQRWRAHPDSQAIDSYDGKLLGYGDVPPRSTGSVHVKVARTFNCVHPRHASTTLPLESSDPDIDSLKRTCKKDRSIAESLLKAIDAARFFIYIEDQYAIDLEAARALHSALGRLKHITILIPHSSFLTVSLPGVWGRRKAFMDTVAFGSEYLQTQRPNVSGHGKRPKHFNVFYRVTPGTETLGRHSYVHAKTWIFDDELAVIGSANCNRRGWSSDTEANVFAFDDPTPRSPAPSRTSVAQSASRPEQPSFARHLRMRLWAEHLGVPMNQVGDGSDFSLWLASRPTSCVRLYNPDQSADVEAQGPGAVDPDFDGLPACAGWDCPDE